MQTADPKALLAQWRNGDRAALDALFPLVYNELRKRARAQLRNERDGHTLTTTALVHETYLKLIGLDHGSSEDRAQFLALAATAMRHVLVSHARRNLTAKRDGGRRVNIEEVQLFTDAASQDLLSLDGALEKLRQFNDRQARTIEMRFFGGLTIEQTAEALGVGVNTVKRDLDKAKSWLAEELDGK